MNTTLDASSVTEILAPPHAVYRALTTHAGLTGWWTTKAEVGTKVGDTIRFIWTEADHTTMRIDRHDLDREVRWTCIDQHDGNLPQPDEWVGTAVRFVIRPTETGCELEATHEGLLALECGDVCSRGWLSFMSQSLKPLVERGAGAPWEA